MTALRMTGREFNEVVTGTNSLVTDMLAKFLQEHHLQTGLDKSRSWYGSLPVLAEDLAAAGLDHVDVLLEYGLPLTSQRAQVVLAGTDPESGNPSIVVVELQQWSEARLFEEDVSLVTVPGTSVPRVHPVRQVSGYTRYMNTYLAELEGHSDWVKGVAYLHGVENEAEIRGLREGGGEAALFTGAERDMFRHYLQKNLSGDIGTGSGHILESSAVRPSTKLMSVAADEVRNREQFVLLGNQQLAVDIVHHEVKRAESSSTKRIIVVSGGPGSGKSVIALSLLGELGRAGRSALHATGSRSFTQTMRKVAGYRSRETQSLFKYFNGFAGADPNELDVLIADEAHRIRETSNNRFTSSSQRSNRLQIDELVSAARVPVFLLDDKQVVRKGELGSVREITHFAQTKGFEVVHIHLDEQFRCGGSEGYITWVEQVLGLTERIPAEAALPNQESFVVEVAHSPWDMESLLRKKMDQGFSARISAGFCWDWSDAVSGGLVNDVVLGDWARPWNNKGDRKVGSAPPAALWATHDGGFDQVGCVYTAQGFEFDWAGVIIGPDLVWREGRFETVRSANKDPHFKSRSQVPDKDFDELVRHIYKVLLTRGMVGTVLYSPDLETRVALRGLLKR